MNSYVLIYGPPSSGKTLNRTALGKHYGCTKVLEDFDVVRTLPEDIGAKILVLGWRSHYALLRGQDVRSIPVHAAKIALGKDWIEPDPLYGAPVAPPVVKTIDDRLDELAEMAVQWRRNRNTGHSPKAIKAAMLTVIGEMGYVERSQA